MGGRLLLAAMLGFPLGLLSVSVLCPLVRRLPSRLYKQAGLTYPAAALAPAEPATWGWHLELVLKVGLSLTPVVILLVWGLSWLACGAIVYCAVALTLACIDAQTRLLPDALTLPLMWAGLLFQLAGGFISLEQSVAGAAAGYTVLWLTGALFRTWTHREGIGFGDFKLAAANGAWLGIEALPWALLVASLGASLVLLGYRLGGRHQSFEPIAFGPFLVFGGILLLFWGQR